MTWDKSREIIRADRTPNKRYRHLTGYVVGEEMIGVDSGLRYVNVVWLEPSVTGDKHQVMPRKFITTIGHEDPDTLILEDWRPGDEP